MKWAVARSTDFVHIGVLMLSGNNRYRSPRAVLGMHSGRVGQVLPEGENPVMPQTFLNQFIKIQGNYPVRNFRALSWVHPAQKLWWRDLSLYALEYFEEELMKIGLHEAVTVTCYGIEISVPNFFAIIELYCLATGTLSEELVKMSCRTNKKNNHHSTR